VTPELSWKTRLKAAASLTAASAFIALLNPIQSLVGTAADALRPFIPLPVLTAYVLGAACVFVALAVLFSTRLGLKLYAAWEAIEKKAEELLPEAFIPGVRTFTVDERNKAVFRNHLLRALQSTSTVYALLVSAHTMVDDDERFLHNALQSGSHGKKKRLFCLLLEPSTPAWSDRARELLSMREDLRRIFCDEAGYLRRCEEIVRTLKELAHSGACEHVSIGHYQSDPSWRLYVFGRRMFVSRYSGHPDSPFHEGHRSDVVVLPATSPMFIWLWREYIRRGKEAGWMPPSLPNE
jgi:hypothetical protein